VSPAKLANNQLPSINETKMTIPVPRCFSVIQAYRVGVNEVNRQRVTVEALIIPALC
jgi:hypothetical protein